jgi:N-acetylglucosaminyldiphosphoundecaprenol N-acetyl-beta-D-mannosaminyltransferase
VTDAPVSQGLVKQRVGPIEFVRTDLTSATELVLHNPASQAGRHIHLLNAYSVALADTDATYRNSVSEAAINFPDGKPVSWVSKLRRDAQPLNQVRGVDLFLSCFERGSERGTRHFLLGSTPETLDALARQLQVRFPEANIVGQFSPPFRALTEDELTEQDARIRELQVDVVWVGLGTPKQDFEVARLASSVEATAVAVGAAFDFVAGTVKEPPRWRRYLIGNVLFLKAVLAPTNRGS